MATCSLSFCLFNQVLNVAVVVQQSRTPLPGVINFLRCIQDDLFEISLRSFFAEPQERMHDLFLQEMPEPFYTK